MRTCSYGIFVVLFGVGPLAANAASECDAILSQGVRNTYQLKSNNDLKSEFEKSFCQKSSGNSGAGRGGNFGFLGSVKIDLGFNSQKAQATAAESCDKQSGKLSDAGFYDLMSYTVDPEIVRAWRDCSTNAYGPMILGELNGNDLTITYRFRPAGAIASTKVTGAPKVRGASCDDSLLKDGATLNSGGVMDSCTRDGNKPVSIVLNTEFGPAKFFIPPVPEKPKLSPEARRFAAGLPPAPSGHYYCIIQTDPGEPFYPAPSACLQSESSSGECKCPMYDTTRRIPPPPAGVDVQKYFDENRGPPIGYKSGQVPDL